MNNIQPPIQTLNDSNVVDALLVEDDGPNQQNGSETTTKKVPSRSLPFRCFDVIGIGWQYLLGVASLIVLLSIVANIPVLQLAALGYLMESMGRIIKTNKLSASLVGIEKARVVGSVLLGIWLIVLPMRALAGFWQDAWLIDPESSQARFLRGLQLFLVPVLLIHIATSIACGGRLRHFLWPLVAPVSMAFGFLRGNRLSRAALDQTLGRLFPKLAADIYHAPPLRDWFVPAVVWRKVKEKRSIGQIYCDARDRTCAFFAGLQLWKYWLLGFKALIGTLLWLVVPTLILASPSGLNPGPAAIVGLLGVLVAVPVFFLLPFLQANFARDGKLKRFIELRAVFRNFNRAPLAHVCALLAIAIAALPLYFLKIERIPSEFFWMVSIVFVLFTWPAKITVGWAVSRGQRNQSLPKWWLRWPMKVLGVATAFLYSMILFFTQYVSWNGSMSLFENHAFLLPAPFWL